ncbi:SIMPL domain-containing protein [Streptomyces sp. NPDC029674]|uniref:SIMPL domain-containing protein n=1 Tax=Streptomyces sp. NPDC029674 TaxID=3365297 RepID=UPI00384E29EB
MVFAARSAAAEALLSAARAESGGGEPYRYETRGEETGLIGHRVSQMFSLTIRDIEKTGAVVRAVVDAPGDASRVHAVAFGIADPDALRARAREAAYRETGKKAARSAELTGHRLGRPVSVDESAGGRPGPLPVPVAAFAKEDVPVAPGRIRDEVSATAVYELR